MKKQTQKERQAVKADGTDTPSNPSALVHSQNVHVPNPEQSKAILKKERRLKKQEKEATESFESMKHSLLSQGVVVVDTPVSGIQVAETDEGFSRVLTKQEKFELRESKRKQAIAQAAAEDRRRKAAAKGMSVG